MNVEITQYGKSEQAGGWDGKGDSGTDAGLGCHNNKLVDGFSCALSKPAEQALVCKVGSILEITFPDGTKVRRRFDDRTDQTLPNARVDFYNEWKFDESLPDKGVVNVT